MKKSSAPTARVTMLMRARTAVPSTVLAATVTATMVEVVRKYSASESAIESIFFLTFKVLCDTFEYISRPLLTCTEILE